VRAVFDHSFHWFVVVGIFVLALNHFHAHKYEGGGGTTAVLP